MSIFVELGQNVALILSLTYIYGLVYTFSLPARRLQHQLIEGIAFGLFGIMAISMAIEISPGFLLDARGSVILMAGIFGGPVSAITASLMVAAYRISLGGAGVAPAMMSLLVFALVGTGVYFYWRAVGMRRPYITFLVLGILTSFNILLWPLLLSGVTGEHFVTTVALPVLLLHPLSVLLSGTLLTHRTRQADMERALRESEQGHRQERDLLRTLIDNLPDYIFVKDAEGLFINSNLAHNRVAHVTNADELRGKTVFDVFPPHLAAQFHADDMATIQSGNALVNVERTTIDADGNERTVLTTKVPLRDESGKVIGLVGISRDITERKELEEKALELKAEQERGRVLRRFIADMSHDFRTPLTIISSAAYMATQVEEPEKRLKHLNRIEGQSSRIKYLLDELLEMSALEQENFPYQFAPVNIIPLIQETVDSFESVALMKEQTLRFQTGLESAVVRVDAQHIIRAVSKLTENALHFTARGGIIMVGAELNHNHIAIFVRDNGIGIAEADLPHIFKHFYRADQSRSTGTGHAGLGLSIAKKIVEAHHGSIQVASQPGQGSTFTIILPLAEATAPEKK